MAKLRLPYHTRFIDRRRNRKYKGPGTFEVPDDRVELYKERRWREVNEAEESEEVTESETFTDEDDTLETSTEFEADSSEVPADESESGGDDEITQGSDKTRGKPWLQYSVSEIESMGYQQLREMAANANRDDINGGSRKQDIIDAFVADIKERQ